MNLHQARQRLCLLLILVLQYVAINGNRCTEVLSRDEMKEIVKQKPCIEKYEARCGWISLNYCTFYRKTFCDKKVNETIKTYFIKADCCAGYFQARNGSCIKKSPGVNYDKLMPTSTTEDPNYVKKPIDKKEKISSDKPKISGGGYAGIICGMVLLVCVIGFTVTAIRKRRRKLKEKPSPAQQVLYVPPSPPTVPIIKSTSNQSQLSSSQREVTPSSSNRVTPPVTPIKITRLSIPHEEGSMSVVSEVPSTSTSKAIPKVTVDMPILFKTEKLNNKTPSNRTDDTSPILNHKNVDDETSSEVTAKTPLVLNIESANIETTGEVSPDTPLVLNIENSDIENPADVSADTPLVIDVENSDSKTPAEISADIPLVLDIENVDSEATAEIPLMFNMENLENESLPESDI